MKVKDLQERRAVLVAEMRSLTEKPAGTGGDLSTEQATRFDTLKGELQTIEKSIERQAFIDEVERRAQGVQIAGSGDANFDDQCRQFSLRAAIAGAAGLAVEWGKEKEIGAELAKRAGRAPQGVFVPMSVFHRPLEKRVVTASGEGSNLIGSDHRGDLYIDALRAKMVVRRLGARVLSGLQGNVTIPRLVGSVASGWVADDSALSLADPDLDTVTLSPKHCGCLTEVSRSVLLQSSPDIEQLLRDDMSKVLANTLDLAAINGGAAGTSNEPDGVLQSGLTTVAFGGGATWSKVLEIVEAVEEGNADADAGAWVTTAAVARLLRSTVRVASTDSRMIMEAPNELAGYPLMKTQNTPRSLGSPQTGDALIFGDWRDVLIGMWSALDILANPFAATPFSKGSIQLRAMMSTDIVIRHAESFAASTDVQPG